MARRLRPDEIPVPPQRSPAVAIRSAAGVVAPLRGASRSHTWALLIALVAAALSLLVGIPQIGWPALPMAMAILLGTFIALRVATAAFVQGTAAFRSTRVWFGRLAPPQKLALGVAGIVFVGSLAVPSGLTIVGPPISYIATLIMWYAMAFLFRAAAGLGVGIVEGVYWLARRFWWVPLVAAAIGIVISAVAK